MCGIPAIGLGLTLAAGAFRAVQQKKQYDQQAAQYKYQAKQAKEDAKVRAHDRRQDRDRVIASQLNHNAAKGIDPIRGSAADLLFDTTEQFAKEQADDQTETDRVTRSLRLSGVNSRQNGQDALWGGLVNTAAGAARNQLDRYAKFGSFF